jgi:hypothetical protein
MASGWCAVNLSIKGGKGCGEIDFFMVFGIELRASCFLGRHSTTCKLPIQRVSL